MNTDEIAKKLVIVSEHEGARVVTLHTNPGWRPASLRCDLGVVRRSPQVTQAQSAVVRRLLKLYAHRDPLSVWIARNAARLGGMGPLTAALLGETYRRRGITSVPGYRALLRSLQRSAPAKKANRKQSHASIKNPDYQARIANLENGGRGNPFASDSVVAIGALDEHRIALIVRGDWTMSQVHKNCKRVSTDFTEDEQKIGPALSLEADIRVVLTNEGAGFVEVVRDHLENTINAAVILEAVHALQIEVKPR